MTGESSIYNLAVKLFPINRSITGNGVRYTLQILKEIYNDMTIYEISTGTKAFDWTVPKEWDVKDAYIEDENKNKIVDLKNNNLHLVGYSVPVDTTMTLSELNKHLYSLPHYPEAIPYVTSYYEESFGFCITHKQRQMLRDEMYHVVIDSELKDGHLTYGEIILPGKIDKEIFLSTYVCHPSMANNELSGPCVAIHLAKWLSEQNHKYTYRIIFIPETIGAVVYLSKNLEQMKKNIIAGFNLTCIGDNGNFSYIPSRYGKTLADKVAQHTLKHNCQKYNIYSYLQRGSDERQYCSPHVDLPVASIIRSRYGSYKEYHTSMDNMDFITSEALNESFEMYKKCLTILENNEYYVTTYPCEPQLGKYGLYPPMKQAGAGIIRRNTINFLAYCDGTNDLIDIANILNIPATQLLDIADRLLENGLIRIV